MVHFTAEEKEALLASAASGAAAPPCPRCGGACAVVRSGPRRDVSYVRNRLLVRCPACRASAGGEAAAESGGLGAQASRFCAWTAWLVLVAGPAAPVPGRLAGQERERMSGPVLLTLPTETRAAAMGGAFWTAGGEGGAVFRHPSLVAGEGFGGSHLRLGAATASVASGSGDWFGGTVAVGVAFMQHGVDGRRLADLPRNADDLAAGGSYAASAFVAAAGYAREVFGIDAGAVAKAVGQRLGADQATGLALDFGASMEVGPATVVLSVQNMGHDLRFPTQRLPLARRVVLGTGTDRMPLGPFDIGIAAQVVRERDGTLAPGGGAEIAWWPLQRRVFIVRLGIQRRPTAPSHDDASAGSPFTFGGGFAGDRIRIDYAYQDRRSANMHQIGLAFR